MENHCQKNRKTKVKIMAKKAKYNPGDEDAESEAPELSVDSLMRFIEKIQDGEILKHWPSEMPKSPVQAARWWIRMQEPGKNNERPRQMQKKSGHGNYWITPYTDRLIHTLGKYIHLPNQDSEFIQAARQEGIFWRGDNMPFFKHASEETKKQREMGAEEYRRHSLKKMRTAIAGMTV